MKAILIDSDADAVQDFLNKSGKINEIELAGTFSTGREAFAFVQKHPVDLVILEIDLQDINGILLAKKLYIWDSEILFLFISQTEKYVMEELRLHAVTYLVKPYSKEELLFAIESAVLLSRRQKKKIFVKTFGHFDVFVDGKPIMFHSAKAKELLALLVDRRGGTVNTDQVIGTLWEERPNDEATQNLCSKINKKLMQELEEYGVQEMLVHSRGIRRVDTEVFHCDLYDLLDGKEDARRQFVGEYMLDYSWAEERMGQLNRIFWGKI